jgi:dolichyl-phosphate-mannose--protein O-mannosyl transferase
MWLGGPQNSWSWRIAVALLGTATVALVFVLGKRIFRSHTWALIAAFFMAIEGQAIVMSRVALLDGILGFFVLLAFWFLLLDRDQLAGRLAGADDGFAIPATWRRPWLLAMGLALGCASAVKWSGIYFIAVFGLYAAGAELFERLANAKKAERALLATEAEVEPEAAGREQVAAGRKRIPLILAAQSAIDFALIVPTALVVYLVSWTGWFISKTGYDYTSSTNPLAALWQYHKDAYAFHVGLRVPHNYQANPLTWLFMQRPTSMFYEGYDEGANGCNLPSGCASAIDPVPNSLIWYAAVAAILWIAYRWLLSRDRTQGLILLGLVAGYLPWMLYLNRTVFEFYTIAFEPWLMLALAYALRHWVDTRLPERRGSARIAVAYFMVAGAALTVFFLPIWIGTTVPHWYWQIHMWLPSWI